MNLKMHTGRLLAITTITGFAIGSALVFGYRVVDQRAFEQGAQGIALREIDHLDTQLRTYVHLVDKVMVEDQSALLNSTVRWADDIERTTAQLAETALADDKNNDLQAIAGYVQEVQQLIDQAAGLRGPDRKDRLADLHDTAEQSIDAIIARIADLQAQLQRRSINEKEDLAAQRLLLIVATWIAALVYVVVVCMAWFWSVQTMVRPIEELSDAAERAKLDNESFVVNESGPDEVRRLTQNISAFVRTRADFLATMSHELRTPLNGIINMNELMLGTELDAEQKDLARSAKGAGEALLAIINDILDFSKIQAKKLSIESAPFGLRRIIDAATEIVAATASSKGLQLAAVVDHRLTENVVGDSTRLRQVLVNLLNNAVKFTDEGSITIRAEIADEETGLVRFAVTDTGVGISADVQATLFRAFQQGDSSTTRKFGGTGLGLAICRELATLMGGEIGVDSAVGEGSTFWFTALLEPDTGTTAARPQPDYACSRLVVASRHPAVREGLRQRAIALQLAADAIVELDDPTAAVDALREGDWLALDPRGCDASIDAMLQAASERLGDTGRVAVVEPLLSGGAAARYEAAADRLPISARLGSLHDWLSKSAVDEQVSAQPQEAQKSKLSGRVLIADDNPINRRAARTFLERCGCEVTTAQDGQEAIDLLLGMPFDVVLMDCQMPRLNGFDASRRIRQLEADQSLADGMAHPLPVLALTAATDAEDRAACEAAGMDGVLPKPFAARDLIEAVQAALQRSADKPSAAAEAQERKASVLIVDDNPMNQRVLAAIVKKAGYATTLANDGQQAVDHLRTTPCDLVLMDCQMPVLDGWEATGLIRELESLGQLPRDSRQRLPVLAVTANAMEGDREKCLDAGMDDYLTKPVKPQKVLEAIASHLRRTNTPTARV
ncbi:MAG: response regulator [Planctomycetes bacterium]|nr:response regulator [Planctomycetota bacterium]